jgi:hypothetical protein
VAHMLPSRTSDNKITRMLPNASAAAPVCALQKLGKEMEEPEARGDF